MKKERDESESDVQTEIFRQEADEVRDANVGSIDISAV